ncbi:AIR synthase-related protein [Curtobacterium sp. 9128]|uniref:AIR synthase-related protein n=1 Tax=Curtobacterium sp. 9128 TaxID=1793722 RepID=UPI00119E3C30|nr:AIR synthase-related protein [Curtobacterium sp. 9128]
MADLYRDAGVDYDVLDVVKQMAVTTAAASAGSLEGSGMSELAGARGTTAYVLETGDEQLGIVMEGLGTKALLAQEYLDATGEDHFAAIAIDAVAAIVNDLVSVGALPVTVLAYFATGDANWYADVDRSRSLLEGWAEGCRLAGASWGGGESPALPGVVVPGALELAGCALGKVPKGRRAVLGDRIAAGDEIVFVASSGLHANGASLARHIVDSTELSWSQRLSDGKTLGEALLTPTHIYAPFVRALHERDAWPKYLNPITGHGLVKVMRSAAEVRYVIEDLPAVPEALRILTDAAGMDERDAYSTLNMGVGMVVIVEPGGGRAIVEAAESVGLPALVAGHVEDGRRSVDVRPLGVVYEGAESHLPQSGAR